MTLQLLRTVTTDVLDPLVSGLTRAGGGIHSGYARYGGRMRQLVDSVGDADARRFDTFPGEWSIGQFSPSYLVPRTADAPYRLVANGNDRARIADLLTYERARIEDVPSIVRCHVLATDEGYRGLPGATGPHLPPDRGLANFVLRSLGPRKLPYWKELVADESKTLFVARTPDGGVVGFVHPEFNDDGSGYLNAWYVLPEWHDLKVGSRLMRSALDYLGPVDIQLHVAVSTKAENIYRGYGFEEIDGLIPTPPPLAEYGLTVLLQGYIRPAAAYEP
ncbi:GNAT family N-acetyltransferase [Nocardia sp. NPDC050710]|uniref:GNAT family N-acetyltransferase n=1 Tax=Nocardia sp. NPDC050710 TaxID=3157220 RepID=UPI0033F9C530